VYNLFVTVNTFLLVFILFSLVVGFLTLLLFFKRYFLSKENQIESLVDRAFGASAQRASEQSRQLLSAEREVIKTDLANKHQELSRLFTELQSSLVKRQDEMRSMEKERAEAFGGLVKQIANQQKITSDLSSATQALSQALKSNQQRGSFGERLIEDMLKSNGLQLNTHYKLQAKLGKTDHRPDVTLLLPNERVVPVDVKFPFSALHELFQAESSERKDFYKKQLSNDMKKHIDKIAEYILPEEGTLDYAVMFVPNEAVFSFLNQNLPSSIDYSLSKRVLVTSPFTFLVVARTIMESYRNFMLGDKLRGVLNQLDGFLGEWQKYKSAVEKLGRAIDTLKNAHEEITGTRFRQLDKKVLKVTQIGQHVLSEGENSITNV